MYYCTPKRLVFSGFASKRKAVKTFFKIMLNKFPKYFKWILLFLLTLIWGSSFILMKEGLMAFTPIEVAGMRMVFAAAALLPFIIRHVGKIEPAKWKWIIIGGLIGNGIPAFLFTLAETRVTSTTAGMLNSLSPVFTLLIAWLIFKNKPRLTQSIGVLIGMVGALALIYFQQGNTGIKADPYAWYVVLACFGYGCSVNIIRNHFGGMNPVHAAGFALTFAALPYFIYFVSSGFFTSMGHQPYFGRAMASVAVLGIMGSAVATVLFNMLVKASSALFAASVTYLMPIVSISLGVLYGEKVNQMQVIGLAVILGGVYLISLKPKPKALESGQAN